MSYSNKQFYIFILLLVAFATCNGQSSKKLSLDQLYQKYTINKSEINIINFFHAFPNSYLEFQNLYGFDEKTGASQYYDMAKRHVSLFFRASEYIPKSVFIEKLAAISEHGSWDADAVSYFQDGLKSYFFKESDEFLKVLRGKTSAETLDFWYFYLDGPHFNEKIYERTSVLVRKDVIIAELFEQSARRVRKANSIE